jgi:hypothetical protein
LIEDLDSKAIVTPNEVQTSQPENGLSTAIAALSVVLLESAINRTQYMRTKLLQQESSAEAQEPLPPGGPQEPAPARRSAFLYFTQVSDDPNLVNDVEEVFAIRDAIAHNHLWEADIQWGDDGNLRFASPPVLVAGYGDKRFLKVLSPETRQTRRLRLNLFPPRVWRRDAYVTLGKVVEVLLSLEKMDRRYVYISQQSFIFRGVFRGLTDIIILLPTLQAD